MDWYTNLVRPWLFRHDAEHAHEIAMAALGATPESLCRFAARFAAEPDPGLAQRLWGLRFRHPLGLAAGLDKDGAAVGALSALGFSHVEIGTVTAHPQPGNERPRLFRLRGDRAVINRMGFNNMGAAAVAARLSRRFSPARAEGPRPGALLGINLGKSKITPLEEAGEDYARSLESLAPWADYLVVNVSSPNTPGLRDLQDEARLRPLLAEVSAARGRVAPSCPLLVKIAPDLAPAALDAAVDAALAAGCDGVILTNTTIAREPLSGRGARAAATIGAGGLSGRPLRARAEAVLAQVARRLRRQRHAPPIIGVGGIDSVEAAWRRIGLGASLVQVYTGLIYQGPGLVGLLVRGLAHELARAGLGSIAEAVGRDL
jgi:dihydroorotate dehydrogenase